jgi:hypothetical protein
MATHKGVEHHKKAAEHHELAAKHHREAAKLHEAGNNEKVAHHSEICHHLIQPDLSARLDEPEGPSELPHTLVEEVPSLTMPGHMTICRYIHDARYRGPSQSF